MATTAQRIRAEIEANLAERIPSALTPSPRLIHVAEATGIDELDGLLHGGLPVGAISEIVGTECSGRTGLVLAFVARQTQAGRVCAWVDVSDTLHPESAAATGVHLERLLWVRCGDQRLPSAEMRVSPATEIKAPETVRVQLGGNSPHPRSEGKGLPLAVSDLLGINDTSRRNKAVGTPGAPNRKLSSVAVDGYVSSEQIAPDRLPSRRGQYVLEQREAYEPRCAGPQGKAPSQMKNYRPDGNRTDYRSRATLTERKPWQRLDQALRVTDLLLQTGGFGAVVLDMGSILPEFALRVPLATWFRYRAAAERTQSSVLLITQHPCAKSSAGLILRLDSGQPTEAGATVFTGLTNHAELSRRRYESRAENVLPMRKPLQRANIADWHTKTVWTGRQ
jgi:hypothetical protein